MQAAWDLRAADGMGGGEAEGREWGWRETGGGTLISHEHCVKCMAFVCHRSLAQESRTIAPDVRYKDRPPPKKSRHQRNQGPIHEIIIAIANDCIIAEDEVPPVS
jgi:hypothetical protein